MATTDTFSQDILKLLELMESVYSRKELFYREDRLYKDRVMDRPVSTASQGNVMRIIKEIDHDYYSKMNFRNTDDPNNDSVIGELIDRVKEIKRELSLLLEQ